MQAAHSKIVDATDYMAQQSRNQKRINHPAFALRGYGGQAKHALARLRREIHEKKKREPRINTSLRQRLRLGRLITRILDTQCWILYKIKHFTSSASRNTQPQHTKNSKKPLYAS